MRPAFYYFGSLVAGALTPFAIAPFEHFWLVFLTLATFTFTLHQAVSRKACLLHGFLFGLGCFSVGVSWVFVSIYQYGSAPLPLALLLTTLFVVLVALVFALPFYLLGYFRRDHWRLLLGLPLLWVLGEWLRTWLFTGFPWLFLGYSQLDTPLAGWAPIGGVLLVSLLTAFSGSVFCGILARQTPANTRILAVIGVVIAWSEGSALRSLQWTKPAGDSLSVGIVQPNIPQQLKWDPKFRQPTIDILSGLTADLWDRDWIVWPEAAIPDTYSGAQSLLADIDKLALSNQASLFTGVLFDDYQSNQYFNSIVGLGKARGIYHKQHLVPFGEYVPIERWLRGLIDFFDLPTSIITRGTAGQKGLQAGDYQIASAICYEIVYPALMAELAKASHAIVTISNDGWFGKSIGPRQHFHMARMRALETGRYVVRATNNGVSAIIAPDGTVQQQSTQFMRTSLTGEIVPMQGNTPFILWRNYLVLALLLLSAGGLIYGNQQPPGRND